MDNESKEVGGRGVGRSKLGDWPRCPSRQAHSRRPLVFILFLLLLSLSGGH